MSVDNNALKTMANRLRRHSILMTTEAGSGHPSTCMSAAEIFSVLYFDEMRWDPKDPSGDDADVLVLSKGHAAPIQWAALKEAGAISEDLMTLRRFDSPLEGHPTPLSPWVRVATGSLGQGLSTAAGMAWGRKLDESEARVFCLMGDGECAEGSVWEAAQFTAVHGLDNLTAIVDVNRLGQSGPTAYGHDVESYARRFRAWGWDALVIDGHDVEALRGAFAKARNTKGRPVAIVCKTFKGKGVSFIEDKDAWHGRPLKKGEELDKALAEIGPAEISIPVAARRYSAAPNRMAAVEPRLTPAYEKGKEVATREAYGAALAKLAAESPQVVAIDGDTKNSTFSDRILAVAPQRYAEGYIAEQNMIGVALGASTEGKIPFAASFACFLTRGYDFIRMAAISRPKHLVITGSHAGVSIGEDGASQMALEDLAMMRAILGATVLYPSDAVSAERLVEAAANTDGIVYLRMSRPKTPVLYDNAERFPVGGSKTLRSSAADAVTLVGAGVTLHEALKAADVLAKEGITARVIDLYSVKPIDAATLRKAAAETKGFVVAEDHNACGGLGEAVMAVVCGRARVEHLAVREIPRSGPPTTLMHAYGIDADAIVAAVRRLLSA